MRDLPMRYETWSTILAKHEKNWAEKGLYNLDALHSNQCQVERELRKGRMTKEDYDKITARHEALVAAIIGTVGTDAPRRNTVSKSEKQKQKRFKCKK